MTRALLTCCALLVVLTGSAGARAATPSLAGVMVTVDLRTYTYPHFAYETPIGSRTLVLTCDPPSGSVPFAVRLCGSIRAHPQAMLDPAEAPPHACWRGVVSGPMPISIVGPNGLPIRRTIEEATVTVVANGKTRVLPGQSCSTLGSIAYAIYTAAAYNRYSEIVQLETTLQCEEDPAATLLRQMTDASRNACLAGRWTAANERLIRIAQTAPAIAALDPGRHFMRDPGIQACTLPVGRAGKRSLEAQCGVWVAGNIVSFVQDWSGQTLSIRPAMPLVVPIGFDESNTRKTWSPFHVSARHVWDVVVQGGRVKSVSQRGYLPPQRWR